MRERTLLRLIEFTVDRIDDNPEPQDLECLEDLQKCAVECGYAQIAADTAALLKTKTEEAEAAWRDAEEEWEARNWM